MPYRYLYTTGDKRDTVIYTFENESSAMEWDGEMKGIKYKVAHINEDIHTVDERWGPYRAWLIQVRAFRSKWGTASVPNDILRAYDDINHHVQEHDGGQ